MYFSNSQKQNAQFLIFLLEISVHFIYPMLIYAELILRTFILSRYFKKKTVYFINYYIHNLK